MRAALAPWMMNQLWATKKGRFELEELMVYHMMNKQQKIDAKPPEQKEAELQTRIHQVFGMVAEAAKRK